MTTKDPHKEMRLIIVTFAAGISFIGLYFIAKVSMTIAIGVFLLMLGNNLSMKADSIAKIWIK